MSNISKPTDAMTPRTVELLQKCRGLKGCDLMRCMEWESPCPPLPTHERIPPAPRSQAKSEPRATTIRQSCKKPSGPGTELKARLTDLGIPAGWCEGCNGRAVTMDRNGIEWCRQNRDLIVSWLIEAEGNFARAAAAEARADGKEPTAAQVQRAKSAQRWKTGWAAAAKMIWINPLDPFGSLVDEAIRRAEENACCKTE